MNTGIVRYEVVAFSELGTFGVMAYSDGDIALGIDHHWLNRRDAEAALGRYAANRAAHGRTSVEEHRRLG